MTEGEHRLWRRGKKGAELQGSWDGAGGGGRKGREWHLVLAVE